ncbi:hypothetical protein [Hoeflea marina]|uniref:hypothetical protein n=1 Tax=Hoeflea marina TaxID=274592 RepID=UPI0011B3E293|nr:hypothetical protein [Hoeflea marina]
MAMTTTAKLATNKDMETKAARSRANAGMGISCFSVMYLLCSFFVLLSTRVLGHSGSSGTPLRLLHSGPDRSGIGLAAARSKRAGPTARWTGDDSADQEGLPDDGDISHQVLHGGMQPADPASRSGACPARHPPSAVIGRRSSPARQALLRFGHCLKPDQRRFLCFLVMENLCGIRYPRGIA